jgi:hypothetical protein
MHPALKIATLVLLPLIWGVGVELIVERIRRARARKKARRQMGQDVS